MDKDQHVVPHPGGWAVQNGGSEQITSIHRTQREAYKRAQEIASEHQSEVVTHRKDGTIRRQDRPKSTRH